MAPYAYMTFGDLKAALLQRLQDILTPAYTTSTGFGFTTPIEAGLYLIEALRTLNSLVAVWNADYVLNFAPGDTWKSLNVGGSPRVRTVTDTDILTLMEYHLLEPPSGSVWTGTTQFNITDLAQALQYRRDELLQASGANLVSLQQPSPVAGFRTTLPDTVLALRRVRWVPIPLGGAAYPLWREDAVTVDAYGGQLTTDVANPESWLITANAPLQFDVDAVPPVPGQWDMLAFESGAPLAPPAATVLGLPDDWCWVAKWGALADVLSNSPEGADALRARYCTERYKQGMKAMLALPWLLTANVAAITVDTPSVEEADAYAQNWEVTWPAADPQLVVGGMDLLALAPFASAAVVSSVVTVVGNAPVPAVDGDPIQLSRDGIDAVLAYAQHLAMFKMGGSEFSQSIPLLAQFEAYCARENSRYRALGVLRTDMIHEGSRTTDIDPRFEPEAATDA